MMVHHDFYCLQLGGIFSKGDISIYSIGRRIKDEVNDEPQFYGKGSSAVPEASPFLDSGARPTSVEAQALKKTVSTLLLRPSAISENAAPDALLVVHSNKIQLIVISFRRVVPTKEEETERYCVSEEPYDIGAITESSDIWCRASESPLFSPPDNPKCSLTLLLTFSPFPLSN